jgi:hypothetical protein
MLIPATHDADRGVDFERGVAVSHRISTFHRYGLALMERDSAGIRVELLYQRRADAVYVRYANAGNGEAFVIAVPKARALDAYHHPLAYRDAVRGRLESAGGLHEVPAAVGEA